MSKDEINSSAGHLHPPKNLSLPKSKNSAKSRASPPASQNDTPPHANKISNVSGTGSTKADWQHPEAIPPDEFPHISANTGKPQPTLENFLHMITFYEIRITYNVISKRIDILIPGLQGSPDNIDNAALAVVISLANLNQIGSSNVMLYIGAIANLNYVNPIADWIHSKSWDGKDRIDALMNTIQPSADYPTHLRDRLVKRWILSASAAVLIPGFHCRGVLTLQGGQGVGKTAFVRSLVPPGFLRDNYVKLDHHLDPNNKDTIIGAVSHWIVEIGELDSTFRKDIARLKGFITASQDKVRVPYARTASEFPRRTVFIATVNSDQFLVDETGNTRWWTIPVESINYEHDIDMQQLWAQAAHLVEVEGEQWWLNEHEEALLESHNHQFMRASVVSDLLQSRLNWDAPKDQYTPRSATDVLKMIGIERPTNTQARDCGAELRVRLGPPKKSQGKTRWYVPPLIQYTQIGEDDEF